MDNVLVKNPEQTSNYTKNNNNHKIKEATGVETGLSGDDQIKIALQCMIKNGGQASMEAIYDAVEAEMNGYTLSNQGRASLRSFINKTAINKNYVHSYDKDSPNWRITAQGRRYIRENESSEGIEAENIEDDTSDQTSTKEPYDPAKVKIRLDPAPFSVFEVMRKINLKEINLQPDFQRHIVWDETRQSRLIESILLRIPLPAFYLDGVDDDNWLVVDGLQRLSTLNKFVNKNELVLKNMEFLQELNGLTFNQLPRKFQRQIEDARLNFYIIQPDTPAKVKFTIFYRINTGGLVLTSQEIRHALFQGKATKLLKQLANSPEFKEATTNSINTRRMDDQEAVLRFLAFYLTPYSDYKKSDLNGFLSDTMEFINGLTPTEISELENIFLAAMTKAKAIFGPYAFRKMYELDGKRYPISKALFEVWSVALTQYDLKTLQKFKDKIVDEFINIMNTNNYFTKAISQGTGGVSSVHTRFSTIQELLARIIT